MRVLPRQRRQEATVPVPASLVAHLRSAVREMDEAAEGQRGACRDDVLACARALLDELPEAPR